MTRVKKAEIFGEMTIIDGMPRRATAITLEPSTVSMVAKSMIEEKMGNADSATRFIIQSLIASLRKVPEKFAAKPLQVSDTARELIEVVHGFSQSENALPENESGSGGANE